MPREVHGHRRLIAQRGAVAPNHPRLEVGGVCRQRIAFPHAGRESAGRVGRIRTGMRTPVHPDGRDVTIHPPADSPGDQPSRDRIQHAIDGQTKRTQHDVERREVAALVFGQRHGGVLKAQSARSSLVVERQPQVIDRIGTRPALHVVLVRAAGPVPAEIELGEGRSADEYRQDDESAQPQKFHVANPSQTPSLRNRTTQRPRRRTEDRQESPPSTRGVHRPTHRGAFLAASSCSRSGLISTETVVAFATSWRNSQAALEFIELSTASDPISRHRPLF